MFSCLLTLTRRLPLLTRLSHHHHSATAIQLHPPTCLSFASRFSSRARPPLPSPFSLRLRRVRKFFLRATSLALIAYAVDQMADRYASRSPAAAKAQLIINSSIRLSRDVYTLALIIADYELSLRDSAAVSGLSRDLRLREIHRRCALRLKELLFKNGGIYLKFAQHIAQSRHILPSEYVEVCADSLSRAPVTEDFQEIRDTIKEEFGAYPEEIFVHFDEKPIASASLAQVHYATLANPESESEGDGYQSVIPVAVKVQHRFLLHSVESDLFVIESLVKAVNYLFPEFDYTWLATTVRKNLPSECDFLLEAQNCIRTAKLFRSNPDVAVPRVIQQLSSKRVLTMEFMDGVECTNKQQLAEWNFDFASISELISHVFCEMIFTTGFLHADPHPGNIFIRRNPNNLSQPQLVLLDHGLYVQLDDSIRYKYSNLWRALIFSDAAGIERWARELNAGDNWMIFSGMIARKGWDEIMGQQMAESDHKITKTRPFEHLQHQFDNDERNRLQRYTVQYSKEIQQTLSRLPLELILILKTNDCLRFIDQELKNNFNGFIVMTRYCINNINQFNYQHSENNPFRSEQKSRFAIRLENLWSKITLELGIFAFEHYLLFNAVVSRFQSILTWPFRVIRQKLAQEKRREREEYAEQNVILLAQQ